MPIRQITVYGEPVLHKRAAEVTEFNDELRALVADMHATMDAAHGVGLAAPQIGVGLRIFTYIYADQDTAPERGVVINPRLTLSKVSQASPDADEESEGCLSVPGLSFPLKRADYAKIEGVDEFGKPVSFEANGWFARIMQHEYDHLDGFLYVDKLVPKWDKRWLKAKKSLGWGVPGNTWLPGTDEDPFGHGE
ncbi:peptide deformylase [Glutamicibacter sp. MNS18]|uniref:peptide deformylase n=1 Tax=Glutamicibacter sp. MNS18 TaxID=2989817 RepID=UPI00223543D4|nr:peptide deformylase [Glutamicibacter sp. MNS18]MCW4464960.1 peptide deformylase [Glutamicibacter sp. MNS18]